MSWKKISRLWCNAQIPVKIMQRDTYFLLLLFISSRNIPKRNTYRTGFLPRGVADLNLLDIILFLEYNITNIMMSFKVNRTDISDRAIVYFYGTCLLGWRVGDFNFKRNFISHLDCDLMYCCVFTISRNSRTSSVGGLATCYFSGSLTIK